MADRVIKLSRTYEAFGKPFSEVVLREPKLRDLIAIGEPVELHPGPDGQGRFIVEHLDRVEKYLDRLCVPERPGRECLGDIDLGDAMLIKEAVVDFFTEAHKRRASSTSSPSGQSSQSAT